jgi:hypothetical protein
LKVVLLVDYACGFVPSRGNSTAGHHLWKPLKADKVDANGNRLELGYQPCIGGGGGHDG